MYCCYLTKETKTADNRPTIKTSKRIKEPIKHCTGNECKFVFYARFLFFSFFFPRFFFLFPFFFLQIWSRNSRKSKYAANDIKHIHFFDISLILTLNLISYRSRERFLVRNQPSTFFRPFELT